MECGKLAFVIFPGEAEAIGLVSTLGAKRRCHVSGKLLSSHLRK